MAYHSSSVTGWYDGTTEWKKQNLSSGKSAWIYTPFCIDDPWYRLLFLRLFVVLSLVFNLLSFAIITLVLYCLCFEWCWVGECIALILLSFFFLSLPTIQGWRVRTTHTFLCCILVLWMNLVHLPAMSKIGTVDFHVRFFISQSCWLDII